MKILIEGIKPITVDNQVIYKIGIFKIFVKKASEKKTSSKNFDEYGPSFVEEVLNGVQLH
jgi:hypothetical protein